MDESQSRLAPPSYEETHVRLSRSLSRASDVQHPIVAVTVPMNQSVLAEEFNLAGTVAVSFSVDRGQPLVVTSSRLRGSPIAFLSFAEVVQFLREAFLPDGFPHSVTPDYLPYQIADSVQAFASSITGLLATRAATATGALVTWVIKDGTGMLGKILFAWKVNTRLDSDAKSWRFVADILNDSAILIEVVSSYLPTHLFPYLAASATLVRAACGVAAGASKSALTFHFAKQGNAGDLNAKEGSQETVVGLAGMLTGTFLLTSLPDNLPVTLTLFLLFTFTHLLVNYLGVRSVVLSTLNRQRASILIRDWAVKCGETWGGARAPEALSTAEVARREGVFWRQRRPGIRFGCRLHDVLGPTKSQVHLSLLLRTFRTDNYILSHHSNSVYVALSSSASARDIARAYFHAVVLSSAVMGEWNWRGWRAGVAGWARKGDKKGLSALERHGDIGTDGLQEAVAALGDATMETLSFTRAAFDMLVDEVEAKGWDVRRLEERSMLEEGAWRYRAGDSLKGE
ncbi:DUF647-domain-containing protein [Gonapodya prolifera JEL478]|uniref:DUF647-domain-containing protein n=1 Tax=Gonapodya prolifera (strain JEL478) TaxID=1344416 RepID=A0A139A281_GONPJ|nr:DUF647-domain-containing protein [Gonapodya prolifera JEL478]|eukprot:KXS10896.1 DUF647-domain-containing protein [Gonapodya prolifera JEL478]